MSVTLYTKRAQRENKTMVGKLNEVDKAITVFGRDSVFVKKWEKILKYTIFLHHKYLNRNSYMNKYVLSVFLVYL